MTDIPTVEQINRLLAQVYTDVGVLMWWKSRNRNLHGATPQELFNIGGDYGLQQVLAEAERVAGGAW